MKILPFLPPFYIYFCSEQSPWNPERTGLIDASCDKLKLPSTPIPKPATNDFLISTRLHLTNSEMMNNSGHGITPVTV
jgi:hypothetical protein